MRTLTWPRFFVVLACSALVAGATCSGAGPADEPVGALSPAMPSALAVQQQPVIGPDDLIEVRVFNEKELSGDHRVGADGRIRLPLAGEVSLEGLTPGAASERIAAVYNERFLRNAHVTVIVRESNSRKIYVLGQVQKPGSYPYEERMTVIAAIARAGGTSKLADANRTLITRETGNDTVRMTVELADIGRGRAPDVELRPGDIIFVPETWF